VRAIFPGGERVPLDPGVGWRPCWSP